MHGDGVVAANIGQYSTGMAVIMHEILRNNFKPVYIARLGLLDGFPMLRGATPRPLRADPPAPARRRSFGNRLETGMAAFNTLLPVVQGQRIGLFAGSGVGKSSLLGHLGRHMQADVVVIALIGERCLE